MFKSIKELTGHDICSTGGIMSKEGALKTKKKKYSKDGANIL